MASLHSSWANATDQQLWRGLRDGNELAFTAVFERYYRTLYNYGSKLTSNSSLVEDAVQDVFIDIWRMRATLADDIKSIKFYLYRSMRRRLHRMQDKYSTNHTIDSLSEDVAALTSGPEEDLQIEQESKDLVSRRIQELLTYLPKRQAEALTLYYYDEFSVHEISQLMDINQKSVRNFIHRALTSLRQSRNWLIGSLLITWYLMSL